jgi:prevent-host-death family protein
MNSIVVGIREFRARLAEYLLESEQPIAVTRHGHTVGYFIPARAARVDLDRATLREAATKMDGLLKRAGFGEAQLDQATRELRARRKSARRARVTPK